MEIGSELTEKSAKIMLSWLIIFNVTLSILLFFRLHFFINTALGRSLSKMQIISIYVSYKFYDAQIQTIILYLTEFLDKCNCTLYKVLVENAENVSMCDTWGSLITYTLLNYFIT